MEQSDLDLEEARDHDDFIVDDCHVPDSDHGNAVVAALIRAAGGGRGHLAVIISFISH